uniref:Uncharacterized protein n=1 Tax=Arundo donax TaxID=35708 RepID=A0A0A9BQA3_ARUDO
MAACGCEAAVETRGFFSIPLNSICVPLCS